MSYTSSVAYRYFIPFAIFCGGVMCLLWPFLIPGAHEMPRAVNALQTAVGVLLLALFYASLGKFGVVMVSVDGVTVRQRRKTHSFTWQDVLSFRTVPFVTPAIHRFSFRGTDLVTYFVPSRGWSLCIGIWTFHFSRMATFIRAQMVAAAAARDRDARRERYRVLAGGAADEVRSSFGGEEDPD